MKFQYMCADSMHMDDIFEGKLPENIILLPNSYSGKDIIKISDALVTLHGTSGIEFAAG